MPALSGTPAPIGDPTDAAGIIALLERRLARSETARAAAESLLEQKSRVLARANEELEARKEDLSASLERRTRQLLDAQRVAGFGTMIWDIRARRLELSPQVRLMFGLDPDSDVRNYRPMLRQVVVADRPRLLRWMHGEVLGSLWRGGCTSCSREKAAIIKQQDERRSCHSDDFKIEFRCHRGRGSAVQHLRLMAQIEFDARCRASVIFVTVQDITREVLADEEARLLHEREQRRLNDLERLNQQLSLAREHAERANAAKSRFLAMMSHDIRTPLNGVIGMLSLLDEGGLTDEQHRTLQLVRSSGDQLKVLLNDIIDLARAEAGKLQLSPVPTQPRTVLQEGGDFWRYLAAERKLTLDVLLAHDIPAWVEIDRVRLRQLIDNLLSNAIKYTREGGVTMRGQYLDSGVLRVEVIDSGIGIPTERHTELFEDFGQLNLLGSEPGGAGLGLAICKRIIDVMHGSIGVTDASPGTCFWFEIPCPRITPPLCKISSAPPPLRTTAGQRPRILVAEDLATNRIVIEGHLRKLDCDVTLVADGREAVEAMMADDFDLILMDMAMPVMDGPTATRNIRALAGTKGAIPIVALTAYARPEELRPMIDAGANASACKPVMAQGLRAVMAELLHMRPAG